MSWDLLQRFLESDVFNSNPFLSVSYLSRYADHVGIHYVLCNKLRQFPYEDIEFFLPQLCHLIISVDNESMALEEFLLDLCEESVTAALLTFWLFQTYLYDLSSNPQSDAFQTCRRVYNKVQHIVFGVADTARNDKIKENVLPVTVLASFVLASVALPMFPRWAGPLAVAQARKPQPLTDLVAEAKATIKPSRAHTVNTTNSRSRRARDSGRTLSAPDPKGSREPSREPVARTPRAPPDSPSATPVSRSKTPKESTRASALELKSLEARLSTSSLPLPSPQPATRPATPSSARVSPRPGDNFTRRHSHHSKALLSATELSPVQKMRLLRQHYFRSQTQFLTALEGISNRLVLVPKPARMSALRAELALISQDLPAEVDIPVICPPTLMNGSPGKSRHHRIVRVNPAEATVLNSAEKVPYLIMIEVLRDDFSFDPDSPENRRLLNSLLDGSAKSKRIFDLTDSPQMSPTVRAPEPIVDSVFEPTSGDLGSSPLIRSFDDDSTRFPPRAIQHRSTQRLPSGTSASSANLDMVTPGTPEAIGSRSTSPGPGLRRMTLSIQRNAPADQPDFSALATHMRTASQMLAQLDATSGKRPKHEVAAIRAKIIASMQSLEEQSFDTEEQGPTFDGIIARVSTTPITASNPDLEDDATIDPNINASAGRERMENDIKTGGVQRRGDRDDPSAAVFGEAWEAKKERIRKSSPYGWMKNWDLISVIVKTGADLRQEAFACQLIDVCHKIWVDTEVDVWVKRMRILVTGESGGLVETITSGVSLHSLKRSLTLASIEAGQNPRHRIATLKDHFLRAFGQPDSEPFKAGVDAFKRSLAAYSIISYVLQLKDRHNGNVLVDSEGHIIHIDFGFMLSNSPGSVGFEAAPFKLTHEYVDVLGGLGSPDYEDYKKLCKQAFQALRRSADNIIDLVAMMGHDSKMPCFAVGVAQATNTLRHRFQLHLSADEAEQFVETDLIAKSFGSYYTRLYDTFQYRTQGIY
ncbi:Phosphatidylinositol 4-kinase pik1alpha (PI4-kinase)(PtdIns-4-kinase) [Neonectria punicea]|uniref:1-phosphatidylinositol 4-kinase n=1 Tax=Neonectria punicea TaxID=979145 RepID=A0ABR1GPR1_9HYPO